MIAQHPEQPPKDSHQQPQTDINPHPYVNPQQLHQHPKNQPINHGDQHELNLNTEVHVEYRQIAESKEINQQNNGEKIKQASHSQENDHAQLKLNAHQSKQIIQNPVIADSKQENQQHLNIQNQAQQIQHTKQQPQTSHKEDQTNKLEQQASVKHEKHPKQEIQLEENKQNNIQNTHLQRPDQKHREIENEEKPKEKIQQRQQQRVQEAYHQQNIIPMKNQHISNENIGLNIQKEHNQHLKVENQGVEHKEAQNAQKNIEQKHVNQQEAHVNKGDKEPSQKLSKQEQKQGGLEQQSMPNLQKQAEQHPGEPNSFIFTPNDEIKIEKTDNEQSQNENNCEAPDDKPQNLKQENQNEKQEISQHEHKIEQQKEKENQQYNSNQNLNHTGNANQNQKEIIHQKQKENHTHNTNPIDHHNNNQDDNENDPQSSKGDHEPMEIHIHEEAIKQEQNRDNQQKKDKQDDFILPRLPTLKLTTEIHQDSEQEQGKEKIHNPQLVEFVQYQPQNHIEKEHNNENYTYRQAHQATQPKIQDEQKAQNYVQSKVNPVSPQFQNIKNEQIRSKLEQLQIQFETINKQPQTNNNHPQNQPSSSTSKQPPKTTRHVVHQKSVHNIVEDLHRIDNDKKHRPAYEPARRRNYKDVDLTKIDLKMGLASNVLNVTIGQVICHEVDIQTETLVQQIQNLKKKLEEVEKKNQIFQKEQSVEQEKERKEKEGNQKANQFKITRSKNPFFGRIYKKSEINNSRVSDSSQTYKDYKHFATFNQMKRVEGKDKNRFSSTMGFRNPQQQAQLEGNKSFHSNFRVKKQLKQAPPSQSDLTQDKQIGFIKKMNSNSKLQFSNQEKLDLQSKNESRRYDFTPHFRQEIEQQCVFYPQNPPQSNWKQYDLIQFAKEAFLKFGINIYQSEGTTLHVKKYKNCVSFILDEDRTILWYYEGRFYFGGWRVNSSGQGQKEGYGYEYVPDKYIYVGQFEQNRRSGEGIMKMLTQDRDIIYSGMWVNGFKEGFGRQIQADDVQYIGEWKDGKKNGFGKVKISQIQSFQGSFKKGMKTGMGKETFKNGDTYKGQYLNGKFHGKGTYFWSNNSMYQGQFQNGLRCGHGIWRSNINEDVYDSYDGEYKNDKKDGFGVYKWKDGNTYEGEFMNDLKHGEGKVIYKDGKVMKYKWSQGNAITKISDRNSERSRKSSGKNPQDSFTKHNNEYVPPASDKSKATTKYRVSQSKYKNPRQSMKLHQM